MRTRLYPTVLSTLMFFVLAGCGGEPKKTASTSPRVEPSESARPTASPSPPRAAPPARHARPSELGNAARNAKIKRLFDKGFDLWKRSCPQAPTYGLCLAQGSVTPYWSSPTVVARDQKLLEEALKQLRGVVDAWGDAKAPASDEKGGKGDKAADAAADQVASMVARARMALADVELERLLADLPPKDESRVEKKGKKEKKGKGKGKGKGKARKGDGKDTPGKEIALAVGFGPWARDAEDLPPPNKEYVRLFAGWARRQTRGLLMLKNGYEKVVALHQWRWALAAVLRVGMAYDSFAWKLIHAPLPSNLVKQSQKDSFISQLYSLGEPIRSRAAQSYKLCLAAASRYNETENPLAKACAARQAAMKRVKLMRRETVVRVVLHHKAELRYCYSTHVLDGRPKAKGKVTLQFTVLPTGAVAASRIQSTTLRQPAFKKCLLDAVAKWVFPAHDGKQMKVRYPIVMTPAHGGALEGSLTVK